MVMMMLIKKSTVRTNDTLCLHLAVGSENAIFRHSSEFKVRRDFQTHFFTCMARRLALALCFCSLYRPLSLRLPPLPPYRLQRMSKSIKSFFSVKAVTLQTDSAGCPEPATKRQRDAPVVEEGSEATEVDAQIAKVAKIDEVCAEEGALTQDGSFGWPPFDTLEAGWKASLSKEFNKSYFQNLMKFLAAEAKTQAIFPPSNEIFTALNLCPLDRVKVSIGH